MSHSSSPARIQISADVEVGFGGSSLSTVSTTTFSDSSDSSLSEPYLAPSAQRALDDDLGEEQGDPFLISDDDVRSRGVTHHLSQHLNPHCCISRDMVRLCVCV